MTIFNEVTFRGHAHDREFADIEAHSPSFEMCHLAAASQPGDWNRIRNVTLVDASQWNCSIDTAALENVTVHNLKRTGSSPLFLWSCVFNHVKLSGRMSGIKINRSVGLGQKNAAAQAGWDEAVSKYYEGVDWALDISEAKFAGGITFEAVPGSLIRTNPETQILISRRSLEREDWRAVDFDGTAIDLAISWFLEGSLFDDVIVAARHDAKWAKRDAQVLEKLRTVGVAK
jgi:hypothetical protein